MGGKKMSAENESTLSEDDIDKLKIPKAISLCTRYGINIEDKPKLQQMKWRLKRQLLCRDEKREKTIKNLDWHAHIDEKRRNDLIEIYNNTIDNTENVMKMKDPIVDELKKCYPDICNVLDSERMKISESKAPILVLGETGCGKSSFINLLLGKNVLPCSLLSNTHVICEIRGSNDTNSFAILDSRDGECKKIDGDPNNYDEFTKELATDIQAVVDGKPKYRIATICIPSDILQSGVVIVDSPGVGESKEMENLVLDYILNACTFIYIIDSTSAGGMQERMQKLVQKVYKKALDEQKEYRPDSAIFICNKWDEVPFDERTEVWEDTKKKIMSCWPDCTDSQIYKFSTHEATYIQARDGMSTKFKPVLEKISQLVPLGQEILLLRAHKFLDDFACHCIHYFGTHLQQVKLSAEEREDMRKTTQKRLHAINTKLDSFFRDQFNTLDKEIKEIAKALGEFLRLPANKSAVCSFADSEIPLKATWNEEAVAVRSVVYTKLMLKIKAWEDEEKKFKQLGENIATAIEAEFPKFEAEIFKVQQTMSKSDAAEMTGFEERDDDNLVPNFIKNKFKGLKFGMKVAVGIGLSPVLVVSMVVNLPVFGFKHIRRSLQAYKFESKFKKINSQNRKNVTSLCKEYASEIVESITDKLSLEKIIEEDMQQLYKYLRQQKQKMETQIDSDLNLLKNLKEEERSAEDITKTYEPLQAKFKILSNRLRHFLFLYIPDRYAFRIPYYDIVKSDNLVCSGYWADVFQGESKKPELTEGAKAIAIRRTNKQMEASYVKKHIKEQEAYSTIKKSYIIQCFGVCTNDGFHYQILEPLKCSLRNHMPSLKCEQEQDWSSMVIKITKELVDGLAYLHDRQLVSLDLSLDTIAVDMSGKIKLTNISLERKILLLPDYEMAKIAVNKYIHFHPCFFNYMYTREKMASNGGNSPPHGQSCEKEIKRDVDSNLDTNTEVSKRQHDQSRTFPRSSSKPTNTSLSNQSNLKRHTIPTSSGSATDHLTDNLTDNCTTIYSQTNMDEKVKPCPADTFITRHSKHIYTIKDDMYAVGVLMCDLMTKDIQCHVTQEKDIPLDAVLANQKGDRIEASGHMEKFMKEFQPKYRTFVDASQMCGVDEELMEQWWCIVSKCVERKISAKEWLYVIEQISLGTKTLVMYEGHFASSPPTY